MSMGNVFESRIYSNNIVEYVREHSVAALFSDARMDPRLGQAKSIIHHSICASMCAPLKPRDAVIGVLYVDNLSVPNRFSEEDLEFITAFANQAAIAIENSRLNQRLADEAVIRNNFLRFFPPAAIKRMTEDKSFRLETIDTEVTALFCDISAFTAMSSRMAPREIVDLLNDYFPVMSEIVFRHEGTLEKYIGDALMAVWGAPFAHPDDPDRAVRAAVEMHRALRVLNVELTRKRNLAIQIHIGLNTGRVAAGNIGSDKYIQYATIGDATNVASRICSAASDGELLISELTRTKLTPGKFEIETLEPIRVKGKEAPLQVHRVRWDLATSGQP
jgi:adenylate cyclase